MTVRVSFVAGDSESLRAEGSMSTGRSAGGAAVWCELKGENGEEGGKDQDESRLSGRGGIMRTCSCSSSTGDCEPEVGRDEVTRGTGGKGAEDGGESNGGLEYVIKPQDIK